MRRCANSSIMSIRRRPPISLQVDQRVEIAHHLDRLAHVGGDDVDQPSGRPCPRRRSGASAGCRGPPRRPGWRRRRRCRGRRYRRRGRCRRTAPTSLPRRKVGVTMVKSLQMAGALPRDRWSMKTSPSFIVCERELVEEVADAQRHRVDVARRAGDGLGQHAALRSKTPAERSPASRVAVPRRRCAPASAPAPRRRRSGGSTSPAGGCGSADGCCSLGGLLKHAIWRSGEWRPIGSSAAAKPCGTMVVVSSSAMMAGPGSDAAGREAAR